MPAVCGEGQTPHNERETKTILNCFLPDWIWYVRAHVEKRHGYIVAVMVLPLTQDLPTEKEKTTNLTELNNCR